MVYALSVIPVQFPDRHNTGEPVESKPQNDEELVRYINLKLAALGQPTSPSDADKYFLEIAGPLLRNYYQKDQLLGDRLCPADARIQGFLNSYLDGAVLQVPRLPVNTFVMDRLGLARVMSLPPGENS